MIYPWQFHIERLDDLRVFADLWQDYGADDHAMACRWLHDLKRWPRCIKIPTCSYRWVVYQGNGPYDMRPLRPDHPLNYYQGVPRSRLLAAHCGLPVWGNSGGRSRAFSTLTLAFMDVIQHMAQAGLPGASYTPLPLPLSRSVKTRTKP